MSIHLLKGSDEVLLSEAASEVIAEVLGDRSRSETLEQFRGDDYPLDLVVQACATESMFGARLVVARNMGRFSAFDLNGVVEAVGELPESVDLVLVWDKPTASGARSSPVPKKLADAVKAAGGEVRSTDAPGGRARDGWTDDRIKESGVNLTSAARRLVEDSIGDDVSSLIGLLEVLKSASAGSEPLDVDDVAPHLGTAGGVPPWDLTDAIDKGNTAVALEKAQRMMQGGNRHPLQMMATLQTHYERMLRLDGAAVGSDKDAAALLGMKGSTFPAKKALQQARKMGTKRLFRATQLLAAADVDLRGATAMPAEAVMEVLVARLAALSGQGGGSRR
jgi:DNA polymerase-3 subunit delta